MPQTEVEALEFSPQGVIGQHPRLLSSNCKRFSKTPLPCRPVRLARGKDRLSLLQR